MKFESKHLENSSKRSELIILAKKNIIPIDNTLKKLQYEAELRELQSELVNLQKWIAKNKMRVAVIFEGRDAAGKGGAIKRFKEHLNPRLARVVALSKPTNVEQGQWYFRRYIKALPNPGEMVFFDRSWYNRAVVEPVMGFCTKGQYQKFMVQESNWLLETLGSNFGNPKDGIKKYEDKAVFTYSTDNTSNLKKLKNTKIRLYTEPDTLWWKNNRMADYKQMNAFYIEKLSKSLIGKGYENVEYIPTINKGYRANGDRHPHSWTIVDKNDLINWILKE